MVHGAANRCLSDGDGVEVEQPVRAVHASQLTPSFSIQQYTLVSVLYGWWLVTTVGMKDDIHVGK